MWNPEFDGVITYLDISCRRSDQFEIYLVMKLVERVKMPTSLIHENERRQCVKVTWESVGSTS